MKRSEKLFLWCALFGAMVSGTLAFFLPWLPWWALLIAGLGACGGLWKEMLRIKQAETIIDSPTITPPR